MPDSRATLPLGADHPSDGAAGRILVTVDDRPIDWRASRAVHNSLANGSTVWGCGGSGPRFTLTGLLLGERVYTARVSAEIAEGLDAKTIAERSPSFRMFVNALMNGSGATVQSPEETQST